VPEGDALHRAARRLQPLVGQTVAASSPNPRAQLLGVAERIDGRRLERVEAVGKNLLLTFDGDLVLRSHLRMKGRWGVQPAGRPTSNAPWLVLRGDDVQAVLWHGPVLELTRGRARTGHLGPDVMDDPPDLDAMLVRFRAADQTRELGEALLDQRLAAGIGNMWKAEGLFAARLSPWVRLHEVSDDDLLRVLGETSAAMRAGRKGRAVYRRAGRPCPRCGTLVASWPQGDDARTAYWCPACQPGGPTR
jgi:endonuclease VIII